MKEEKQKHLKQLVDKHGLRGAAKMLGLTQVELVVELKLFNIPIDYKLANQLLFDLHILGKLPEVYKEYEITIDKFNATFEWRMKSPTDYYGDDGEYEEMFAGYATPFWDGSNFTPVEAIYYTVTKDGKTMIDKEMMGEYLEELKSIKEFRNLEHLLVWYRDFYLPNVYYILNRIFLSDIREESIEN